MLTTLSLWGIYFASYLVDYILILIVYIIKQTAQTDETVHWNAINFLIVGILIIFIAAAVLITFCIWKIRPNTRIKVVPEKNITYEVMGGVFAQVIAVATTIFSDWWVLINITLFVSVGIFFVKSRAVHMSPLFILPLGNRIFQTGEYVIITNYTLQEMKMAQEDNLDGLESRQLAERTYYVRK